MQKTFKYNRFADISKLDNELSNGWVVVNSCVVGKFQDEVIFILEKQTRKEKLEHLNDIDN